MKEISYVMLKPDGVKKGEILAGSSKLEENVLLKEVLKAFNENGLEVMFVQKDNLVNEDAKLEEHYGHVKKYGNDSINGKPIFDNIVNLMKSGDVIKMVVVGEDAIKKVREIVGPTNVAKAKEEAPQSIRARFGSMPEETEFSNSANAIHASGDPKEAIDEVLRFYPQEKLEEVKAKYTDLDAIQVTYSDELNNSKTI